MNVHYLFQEVSVSAIAREYIEKKLESIGRMMELTHAEVEVDKDKLGNYRVEVTVRDARESFRAEETSESIHGSMDMVSEELKRQIRDKKEKSTTIARRGARSIKKKMVVDALARF